jgi:hypothetical protein
MDYPFSSPFLLSDSVFINYGGKTGTSTAFARNAAYFIAEKEMSSHLQTLLKPTNITGSYYWNAGNPFEMDWGYINAVYGVMITANFNWTYTYSAADLAKAVFIRNAKYGQVDINLWPITYQIAQSYPAYAPQPYSVLVSYNAGLPTGTSTQPDMLWCLSMAAQLVLNEMSVDGFLANETPGGIGVQSFSNELYSEKRTPLGSSIFGSSPVSQQITRIVNNLRCRSVGRFRR